ncbi:hypothetical protein MPSEU_000801100 [Mayamaea pseudoterrestris]|nr:hypothetical protein MPSEU_000801100 [Mayamaea pseudoterrestris]
MSEEDTQDDNELREAHDRLAKLSMDSDISGIRLISYKDESQLHHVMKLVGDDLSEPYSIFTYRYFLYRFPYLCILAVPEGQDTPIGCVVAKIDEEDISIAPSQTVNDSSQQQQTNTTVLTGYIGMLTVSEQYRRQGIGKTLVRMVIHRLRALGCTSVTLETEVTNVHAQKLYQDTFGFIREELLEKYYLNWNDAYRLRLWFDVSADQGQPGTIGAVR